MLRRPNQRNAGPTPLGQLLSPRLGLGPSRPNNSMVGARQNLPSSMGYGSLHPHPVEGSQFTGGRVSNPASGLVPSFSPPAPPTSGAPQSSIGPSLASLGLLAPTPHGGAPTPTLPGPPGQVEPPPPKPPMQPPLTTGLSPQPRGSDFAPRDENPFNNAPTRGSEPGGPRSENPFYGSPLAQILLSLVGQRYNPSSPSIRYE